MLFAAVAAAALLAVGLYFAVGRQHRAGRSAGAQEVVLAPAPGSESTQAAAVLFFPQHVARGAGGAEALRLDRQAKGAVTLQLELPVNVASKTAVWSVEIADHGSVRLRLTDLRSREVGGIEFVETNIDPSSLSAGTYSVALFAEGGDRPASVWQLAVTG